MFSIKVATYFIAVIFQGYVGHILSKRYKRHVVGLEREVDRVKGANRLHTQSQHAPRDMQQPEQTANGTRQSQNSPDNLLQSKEFTLQNSEQCFARFDRLLAEVAEYEPEVTVRKPEVTGRKPEVCDREPEVTGCRCNESSSLQCDRVEVSASRTAVCGSSGQCSCSCDESGAQDTASSLDRTLRHDNRKRICLMGLHCCADLTPVMLRYFVR